MVSPAEVAKRREWLLVDIRPRSERASELGFLPGSIAVPLAGPRDAQLAQLAALEHAAGLVLCCTSGRRSAMAWLTLATRAPFPLHHLEGGLLGWEATGLPVCRVPDAPAESPADVRAFQRELLACFVAEATETALDQQRSEFDPEASLRACFRAARVSWESPTLAGMADVLDRAGADTFRAGRDLRKIAANLAAMHATLRALERDAARSGG